VHTFITYSEPEKCSPNV